MTNTSTPVKDSFPIGAATEAHRALARRAPRQWIYRNLTPWRIEYRVNDGEQPVLTIPPLGEVRVPQAECDAWNTSALRQRGQLDVVPAPLDVFERLPSLALLFGFMSLAFVALLCAVIGGTDAVPTRALVALALVVPLVALVAAGAREWVHVRRFRAYRDYFGAKEGPQHSAVGLGAGPGDDDGLAVRVTRTLAETLVLAGSLAVAIVGPAVAIYLSSELRAVLPFDVNELRHFRNPFGGAAADAVHSRAVWQLLVGHAAQWVLVSVAALVPAAMFFQFDRERLAAIQGRWVRHVFRLDPTVRSLRDVQAKYGAHMEASFGSIDPLSRMRVRRGRRSPVVVATILGTVGWVVLATGAQVPQLEHTIAGYAWPKDQYPVPSFFLPQGTALGFAFLGAYLFSIFHVLHGYRQRDLLPKTYNSIVVRYLAAYILTLAALVIVPNATLVNPVLIGFAFFAGFLPQSALVWLRDTSSGLWRQHGDGGLDDGAPLTELEGIDLYDRTRLAEEGVNNVHALAHSDLVELMSTTRIPADRLVDWTDQAILFLRVGGDRVGDAPVDAAAAAVVAGGDAKDALARTRANLRHLRRYGIRNATDLIQAFDEAVHRGEALAALHDETDRAAVRRYVQAEVDQLRETLTTDGMPRDTKTGYFPIQGMLDTLPDEEWFTQIRNWRRSAFGRCESWHWYVDGSSPFPIHPLTGPAAQCCPPDDRPVSLPMRPLERPATS